MSTAHVTRTLSVQSEATLVPMPDGTRRRLVIYATNQGKIELTVSDALLLSRALVNLAVDGAWVDSGVVGHAGTH